MVMTNTQFEGFIMTNQLDPTTTHFTIYYITDGSTRIAEASVAIYPMDDDAFIDGTADDVLIEDTRNLSLHSVSKELARKIIEQIKTERPDEWKEIRAMGARNCASKIAEDKATQWEI